MKLRGLFPNFYIYVSGSNLYIPTIGLIWNLCFPVLREKTFCSTTEAEKRAGNCRQAVVSSSSLPSLQLLRLSWEFTYKFPIWKITDHERKQLTLVVNFFLVWDWMWFLIWHLYRILTGPSFAVYFNSFTWGLQPTGKVSPTTAH
jgi:hypothetical protein